MNLTLHQLELFSQPAVSIQLKKLQEQFSIPLTEVVGRQLYITDFGREIAASAEKIVAEVEAIRYNTKAFSGSLAGKLKLSIASTAKYVMPYFLADFMAQHSGVDLEMDVTNKTRVVESLEENKVDFSLVSVVPKQLNLNRVELLLNGR